MAWYASNVGSSKSKSVKYIENAYVGCGDGQHGTGGIDMIDLETGKATHKIFSTSSGGSGNLVRMQYQAHSSYMWSIIALKDIVSLDGTVKLSKGGYVQLGYQMSNKVYCFKEQ